MVTLIKKSFALLSHNAAPYLNIVICYMTEFFFNLMEFIYLGS